jgi:hypothetical protein
MEKDQLIAKQQLEIENLKEMLENNAEIKKDLGYKLFGIGQPLNDNCLEFNSPQLKWAQSVLDLVENINTLRREYDDE